MIYLDGLLYCMLMSFGSIGSGFEITVRICGRIKSRLKIKGKACCPNHGY